MQSLCKVSVLVIIFVTAIFSVSFAQTAWVKHYDNPVLTNGPVGSWDEKETSFPSVLFYNNEYHMWYSAGQNGIGHATSPDGIIWQKDILNPVMGKGSPGSWEANDVSAPCVIIIDDTLHMWYAGHSVPENNAGYLIGHATSVDGINWTRDTSNPVLDTGSPGTWDDTWVDVNSVVFDGTTYHLWYTAWDGESPDSARIGHATSPVPHGRSWTKDPANPVLIPELTFPWEKTYVRGSSILFDGSTFHMWYSGGRWNLLQVGYATSQNGTSWTKHPVNPVLPVGRDREWDDILIDRCSVISSDSYYKMWYAGYDGKKYQIGYATTQEIPHAINIKSHSSFATETQTISATVKNPGAHNTHVAAIIKTLENLPVDSIPLFDDGEHDDSLAADGLYGGYLNPPSSEDVFAISASVTDLDSGHYHILRNAARFTTIGPVVIDHYELVVDTVPNPGDQLNFYIHLRNDSPSVSVTNLTATLTALDSFATVSPSYYSSTYEDIVSAETAKSKRLYRINITDESFPTNPYELRFALDIQSDSYSFWQDTISIPVDTTFSSLDSDNTKIPGVFALHQNYPNPFNPVTMINYQLPNVSVVELSVFNLLGQKVATLVSKKQNAGYHQVEWDASHLPSGVYFYRLQTGGYVDVKKLIFLK